MATLSFVETIGGPFSAYGADILDIDFDSGANPELVVFAGNSGSARLVNFDVSGTASFTGQTFLGWATDGFVAADYGTITLNLSNARMQDATDLTGANNGQAVDQVALIAVDMGATTYLISSRPNADGLQAFEVLGSGALSPVTPAPDPAVGQISDLATVTAYGQTWVLGTSLTTHGYADQTIQFWCR